MKPETSPLGAVRERPVPCQHPGCRNHTWNHSAACDDHLVHLGSCIACGRPCIGRWCSDSCCWDENGGPAA
jgi:hypothetical protein